METIFIQSPIGVLELKGNAEGLVSVLFKDAKTVVISEIIPKELKDAVVQLQEYFEGKRFSETGLETIAGNTFRKNDKLSANGKPTW